MAKLDPETRRPVDYAPIRRWNPEGTGPHRLDTSLVSVTTWLTPVRAVVGGAGLLLGIVVSVTLVGFVFGLVFRYIVFPVIFTVLLVLMAPHWGIGGFSR